MNDAIRTKKLERISSYKKSKTIVSDKNAELLENVILKTKIIGNSFLGSSKYADDESRKDHGQIGP